MADASILTCLCRNDECQTVLGEATNAWNKIGKGHFCPLEQKISDFPGLVPVGAVRKAPSEPFGDQIFTQDIVCGGCDRLLGLLVHDAPEGRMMKTDQVILRRSQIDILDRRTGESAVLRILKGLALHPHSQDEPTRSIEAHSRQVLETAPQEMPFEEWATVMIEGQRSDLDRIDALVGRIETSMRSLEDFMQEIRTEINKRPTSTIIERIENDMRGLRHDIRGVNRSTVPRDETSVLQVSTDELELLTESISKATTKANEVDGIKMEMSLMKSRIRRLEEMLRSRGHSTSDSISQGTASVSNQSHVRTVSISVPKEISKKRKKQAVGEVDAESDAEVVSSQPKRVRSSTFAEEAGSLREKPLSSIDAASNASSSPKRPKYGVFYTSKTNAAEEQQDLGVGVKNLPRPEFAKPYKSIYSAYVPQANKGTEMPGSHRGPNSEHPSQKANSTQQHSNKAIQAQPEKGAKSSIEIPASLLPSSAPTGRTNPAHPPRTLSQAETTLPPQTQTQARDKTSPTFSSHSGSVPITRFGTMENTQPSLTEKLERFNDGLAQQSQRRALSGSGPGLGAGQRGRSGSNTSGGTGSGVEVHKTGQLGRGGGGGERGGMADVSTHSHKSAAPVQTSEEHAAALRERERRVQDALARM